MTATRHTAWTRAMTILAVAALALLAGGCSSMRYTADWDHEVDFSQYRTFSWLDQRELDRAPQSASPIVIRRFQSEITRSLLASGLSQAPRREADLLVAVHTSAQQRVSVHYQAWGWGCWGCWGPGWGGAHVSTWREGTVVVDVLDRERKQLVWRGIAEGAVNEMSPSPDKVRTVVDELLSAFPPPRR